MPQPALNVNMDAHTNVESLSFSLDGLAKKIVVMHDPAIRSRQKIPIPIPVPNINLLQPPLGARPTPPAKVEFADGRREAQRRRRRSRKALGMMLRTRPTPITGTGSLDVLRYGRVLQSRMLVGVRGAGLAYDGLYYVQERHAQHQARRVQAELHAVARRPDLRSRRGCRA